MVAENLTSYAIRRDLPGDDEGTTHLSAHLKYGCISVRESYHALRHIPSIIRELYFRAFYDQVVWFFPHVLEGQIGKVNRSLRPKYDKIAWGNNEKWYTAWKDGMTGFPIVDAGIRQLAATGIMHNRVRMIVASFLVKDLHIDWRWGERHFASSLVDYYPSANNQGWQWAAGCGADAQQYTRIFNPYIQCSRFDPECKYVKRWVPELRAVPNGDVITWGSRWNVQEGTYIAPIVDHKKQSQLLLEIFARINK
eukprot:gene19571-26254_t